MPLGAEAVERLLDKMDYPDMRTPIAALVYARGKESASTGYCKLLPLLSVCVHLCAIILSCLLICSNSEDVRVARNWYGNSSGTTLAKGLTDGICQLFVRHFGSDLGHHQYWEVFTIAESLHFMTHFEFGIYFNDLHVQDYHEQFETGLMNIALPFLEEWIAKYVCDGLQSIRHCDHAGHFSYKTPNQTTGYVWLYVKWRDWLSNTQEVRWSRVTSFNIIAEKSCHLT